MPCHGDPTMFEALFASDLQPSQRLQPSDVNAAITRTILALGPQGCAARVAQEFGDHPSTAIIRMRWARETVLGDADADRLDEPGTAATGGAATCVGQTHSRAAEARMVTAASAAAPL